MSLKQRLEERAFRIAFEQASHEENQRALGNEDEQYFLEVIRRNANKLNSLERNRVALQDATVFRQGRYATPAGEYGNRMEEISRELEKEGIVNFQSAVMGDAQKPGQLETGGYWHETAFRRLFPEESRGMERREVFAKFHTPMVRSGFTFDVIDKEHGRVTKVFVTDGIPNPDAVTSANRSGILVLSRDFYPVRVVTVTPRRGQPMLVSYIDRPPVKKKR